MGNGEKREPNQGAFIIDELTDLVEEAALRQFDAIAARGGVLGAMETGYQRNNIQDASLYYEHRKHDGTLPIIGVNTFQGNPTEASAQCGLVRSTDTEKQSQVSRLRQFQERHAAEAGAALVCLKQTAIKNENIFSALMDAVRCCSVGQITNALFEVGGQYRRNF